MTTIVVAGCSGAARRSPTSIVRGVLTLTAATSALAIEHFLCSVRALTAVLEGVLSHAHITSSTASESNARVARGTDRPGCPRPASRRARLSNNKRLDRTEHDEM